MGTAIATELEQRDDIVQHIDEWLEQTGSDQRCSGVVYVKRSDGTGYFKAALSPIAHRESHNANRVGI